jgi:hypothetical protein
MGKKLAFCILHYGKPYLKAALEAIVPQVDKVVILYTDTPSQGYTTDMTCPDTRDDLKNIADKFKVAWVDGHWENEGLHCDAIKAYSQDYQWLVRFDADEIYPEGMVNHYIKIAEKSKFKMYRMPFKHFWRSFDRVCYDGQYPFRLERLDGGEGYDWLPCENDEQKICHMGYAMPTKYIEYKMQVQAHRAEWRPDWFENIWLKNGQDNVHPVAYVVPLWQPEDYDKTKLPKVLRDHEYFNMDIIK